MALIDQIAALQAEALQTELTPIRASEVLVELTGLYFNVVKELRDAEFVYNDIEHWHVKAADGVVNRGKATARLTDGYKSYRLWKDTEKTTLQMIQSLKKYMTTMAEEMRLSR